MNYVIQTKNTQRKVTALSLAVLAALAMPAFAATDASQNTEKNALNPLIRQDSQGFSHFIKDKLSLHLETNHYNWEGGDSSKGQQTFTPITLTYRDKTYDVGVRTAFINSKNNTPNRKGEVSTLSDTNISFAGTFPVSKKTSLRYSAEWNLPTGRATLGGSQKNAMMDGGVVDQVRFGEGLNTSTGASIVHNINKSLLVGFGYSHTWLGSYDPNQHILDDDLNPGDQDHITLQTQYRGQRFLLLGGATYTMSDVTQFNHKDYYEKGDRLDVNATGIYALTARDRVTLGARYSTQQKDKFVNRITGNFEKEQRNVNGDTLYVYGEYAKEVVPRHTVKVNASYLTIDANSYNFSSDYYNAGREKVTYGMGYNWQATSKTLAKASIKKYAVTDKATIATGKDTKYSGWNGQLGLSVNF